MGSASRSAPASAAAIERRSRSALRGLRNMWNVSAMLSYSSSESITTDRAFWCLGPATYVSHEGDRPIAFVWKLERHLPAELYTSFAAAVA